MNFIQDFFHTVYNVPELIRIVGQYGLPLIIFAETGLLLGFFLPGDSLLFTAGFLASQGVFRIVVLMALCAVAAGAKRADAREPSPTGFRPFQAQETINAERNAVYRPHTTFDER